MTKESKTAENLADISMAALNKLPEDERKKRIAAFGKKVKSSCEDTPSNDLP